MHLSVYIYIYTFINSNTCNILSNSAWNAQKLGITMAPIILGLYCYNTHSIGLHICIIILDKNLNNFQLLHGAIIIVFYFLPLFEISTRLAMD